MLTDSQELQLQQNAISVAQKKSISMGLPTLDADGLTGTHVEATLIEFSCFIHFSCLKWGSDKYSKRGDERWIVNISTALAMYLPVYKESHEMKTCYS